MKDFKDLYKSKKKNNKIQISKEEKINLAINCHIKGNITEAKKIYKQIINEGYEDHRVLCNYGVILQNQGELIQAELTYRKAIKLNPNFADGHLNLGNISRELGKLIDAEIYTKKAIELNPNSALAHSNLGNISRDLGKLKDAEIHAKKAIELNPNSALAHSNLGSILSDLGKLKDAEIYAKKAIELNPNSALAHSNLGSILSGLGKLKDAEIYAKKAIELDPSYVKAHFNLGFIYKDLGKYQEAFDSYQKVIEINPKFSNIYTSIIEFLNNSDLTQLNKIDLKKILTILLKKNEVSHKQLFNVFRFLYINRMITNLDGLDSDIIKNQFILDETLLIEALKKIIFIDLKLEAQLIKIRKKICDFIAKNENTFNYSSLEFLIALGEQCFLNEYIYSISEEEKRSLNTIINKCIAGELNETNIAILSCYFPLYKLINQLPLLKSKTSTNSNFEKLIELQIKEPIKEIELSKQIKRLGKIDNKISLKVKSQYEVNPYPRWRHGNHIQNNNLSVVQGINNEIKPNYVSRYLDNGKLKILIAGCGTGYHIVQAKKYKNAQITAIDLSLSSLAYAQRKINELKIDNVELIQMDILEVSLLETQFDIIECAGVLHHMENPCRGLKALLDILKNNGFLQLGLYSELARKDIIKARKYIANNKIGANEDNIRNFRQQIVSGELNNFNSLKIFSDFYSLSELRDLCFHTREHRFTISKLDEILQSYNLKFLGFSLPKIIKSNYEKYFPQDKEQTNLQNWKIFEEKYPNTFIEMYQFWISKHSNVT